MTSQVCVCARPSDVTLYHFRLISPFLRVRRQNKGQSERSGKKGHKLAMTQKLNEEVRLDQRTSSRSEASNIKEGAGLTLPASLQLEAPPSTHPVEASIAKRAARLRVRPAIIE